MIDHPLPDVLVDSSVWIDHLRRADPVLTPLLQTSRVRMHPMVLGELACGNLPMRQRTLGWLERLPSMPLAGIADVSTLIEGRRLYGRGVGLIDVHLLASTLLVPGCELLSRERRLDGLAQALRIAAVDEPPRLHRSRSTAATGGYR